MAEASLARRGVISVSFSTGGCARLLRDGRRRLTLASAIIAAAGLLVTWGVVMPAAAATQLAVKTTSLHAATAGKSYSARLAASGGIAPYTWSVTQGALPAGLSLNAATGGITGRPTVPGTASFAVTVSDGETPSASASANLSITVNVAPLAITTGSNLPATQPGVPYSVKLTAAGGIPPYTWSITQGTLTPGLKLHAATGVISGTPTSEGHVATFTAQVSDAEKPPATASTAFTLPDGTGPAGTFTVGSSPDAIASDGTNMWVANSGSNSVTELSPSGAVLGTFPVGTGPAGIAFDGTNMWVANSGSNSVTELSPSGTTVGTFAAGGGPAGIAFDGTNMWVADSGSNSVTRLSPGGAVLGTFAVGGAPAGIAFDGTNMWVANSASNSATELSRTGAVLGMFPVGTGPAGIASDGTNMWVANSGSNSVTELSPGGAVLGTFAAGTRPEGIAFAKTTRTMWVANSGSNSVTDLAN